jgi:hypothetical protein
MSSLEQYASHIKTILREGKYLKKESFEVKKDGYTMSQDEFEILRGILADAKVVKSSVFAELCIGDGGGA